MLDVFQTVCSTGHGFNDRFHRHALYPPCRIQQLTGIGHGQTVWAMFVQQDPQRQILRDNGTKMFIPLVQNIGTRRVSNVDNVLSWPDVLSSTWKEQRQCCVNTIKGKQTRRHCGCLRLYFLTNRLSFSLSLSYYLTRLSRLDFQS